jgi:hypothetical protein
MQAAPQTGLAALATPVAAALTPQTIVSVATAAINFLSIACTWAGDGVLRGLLPEDSDGAGRRQACSSRLRVAPVLTPV